MKFVQIYNPREDSFEILTKLLVGRQGILAELLDDLRRQITSGSRQHWLLRGPRGMGKTHLMAMIYHSVLADPQLSAAYQPVWLSEKAAYEIYSAGWFLKTIATKLQSELSGPIAEELRRDLAALTADGDAPDYFDSVLEILEKTSRSLGKTLVVIVENLDSLLNSFSARNRSAEAQRVRSVMQHDRQFVFIGTTPTHYLPAIADPKKPLFGQFRERKLEGLTEDETGTLFMTLADVYTQPEKRDLLSPTTGEPNRRRIFHRLTAGNPRSIVMAFHVVAGVPNIDGIVNDLRSLLDAQTAYFEARLANLAPRERVIVGALAASDQNLTAQEIARNTGLPERSISTQINRLAEEGHISAVSSSGGKGAVYEVSDGLFRLWYQFREGKRLLEPIVRFLSYWHSPEELADTMSVLSAEMANAQNVLDVDSTRLTLLHIEAAYRFQISDIGRTEREKFYAETDSEDLKHAHALVEAGHYAEAIPALKNLLAHARGTSKNIAIVAKARLDLGIALTNTEQIEEGLGTLQSLIAEFGGSEDPAVLEAAVDASFENAFTLDTIGRAEDAVEAYNSLIRRFGNRTEPLVQANVARAMFNKSLVLARTGRTEQSLDAFRATIDRFGTREEPEFMAPLASAMCGVAWVLGKIATRAESIEAYRRVIERFSHLREPTILSTVALAMINMGVTLAEAKSYDDAIKNFVGVIERFDQAPFIEQVAMAMGNLGNTLREAGRINEAVDAYGATIDRFRDGQTTVTRREVARAMLGRGIALQRRGSATEAAASFRAAIDRFHDSRDYETVRVISYSYQLLISALVAPERHDTAAAYLSWIVRRVDQLTAEDVSKAIQFLLRTIDDTQVIRRGLEALEAADAKDGVRDVARLHRFVLDVLDASQPAGGARGGIAARREKVLRRVPPEVRETVKEMAADILRARKARRKEAPASE